MPVFALLPGCVRFDLPVCDWAVARLDLGEAGGSEITVGSKGNVGASLGLVVPIVPQVLEQTLKPDQPEALASTEQVL